MKHGNEKNKVVVKKNQTVYNNIKWGNSMTNLAGGAVELAKNFTNDKNYKDKVTSTLCYGVQWDRTLQFFNDEDYLKNVDTVSGRGNYINGLLKTGSKENYKIKNIYDMAGNVWEITMEANGDVARVKRGGAGNSSSGYPSSMRLSSTPNSNDAWNGFRITLYLNN